MRVVVAALAVATGLGIAVANSIAFAQHDRWFGMVIGGLFPPLYGLALWWTQRRKGGEARSVADTMIWAVLFACLILTSVLERQP